MNVTRADEHDGFDVLQGIFQSPIIAATLATHMSSISYLPEESRLQQYPAGALALSILAVRPCLKLCRKCRLC